MDFASRSIRAGRRSIPAVPLLLAGALVGLAHATPVSAAASCTDVQKPLLARKSIVEKLQRIAKGKPDPRVVCGEFRQLVSNGASVIKWLDANKDWCQVPDSFAEGIKADHARAQQLQAKACGVAAKQAEMEKKAKESGNTGLLGGPGLEGSYKMPQGAL